MSKIVLEVEAQHVAGVFGASLGAFGYLPNNPTIAEVPINTADDLSAHQKYLDGQHIAYKINGRSYNGANW